MMILKPPIDLAIQVYKALVPHVPYKQTPPVNPPTCILNNCNIISSQSHHFPHIYTHPPSTFTKQKKHH